MGAVADADRMEGQIYVPLVNWTLCVGVVAVTLVFRSADKLGDIYGVAVTGTFILNTILFVAVARLLIAAGSPLDWTPPEGAPSPDGTIEGLIELTRAATALQ